MSNVKELQKERQQLFTDVINGKTPKRVPIQCAINYEAALEYCGYDFKKGQWDTSEIYNMLDRVNQDFPADVCVTGPNLRNPLFYQLLEAKSFVMGTSGIMQHPEIHSLEVDEYDAFSEDPYGFMCDVLLPRLYPALAGSKAQAAINLGKAFKAKADEDANYGAACGPIIEKYGLATNGGGGFGEAPLDFIADFLRSFTGISTDIRRVPDKVKAACNAVLPLMEKMLITKNPNPYQISNIPLHMGPYLNKKQFDEFYWPSFEKLVTAIINANQGLHLFVEQDWMRHIDHLASLPGRIQMRFEFGDPKLVKEKLHGKHIITAMYPIVLLMTGTKQQCVDKAKELLDVLAVDGGYIFNLDKGLYSLKEPVASNLRAVLEYVRENSNY